MTAETKTIGAHRAPLQKNYIIATAGHVDHGKSSLVKALTGIDPDRLPEEKARQITIDLGFAELKLTDEIHAAIVDVPGHEDFVRNMIAGVGSIDLALLVIAADDGWMPQTEEHLQILEYLGVKRAVVCLTKIDIGDADSAERQIRNNLRKTTFANAPLVRTSLTGLTGQSCVTDLTKVLERELSTLEPQRDIGKPRLCVDRAFTLHGIGTIVTGTLSDGVLRRGEKIMVQPRGTPVRIRSIQIHGQDVDLAIPGTRVALNLPDLTAKSDVARGDVITTDSFATTNVIDVALRCSARFGREIALKSRSTVWMHHGATRFRANVDLRGGPVLARGAEAVARLRLASPILAVIDDRFVVRDISEQQTIAGGIILNVDDEPVDAEWLAARAREIDDVDLVVASELQRQLSAKRSDLLRRSRFSAEEISSALQRLRERAEIFLTDDVALKIDLWDETRALALKVIDRFHETHPERSGIESSELRAQLADVAPEIVDLVIVDLCRNECVQIGSTLARRSHRPALPSDLETIATNIRAELSEQPFDPPTQKANDARMQKALKFLIDGGELVELTPQIVLLRDAFAKMKEAVVGFISANGAATVSQLRQELGTSRRIIVPLLELLDRQSVTRRIGDKRALRS